MIKLYNASREETFEWRDKLTLTLAKRWTAQPMLREMEDKLALKKNSFFSFDTSEEVQSVCMYTSLPWIQSDKILGTEESIIESLWNSSDCRKCPFMVYRHTMGVGNLHPKYMFVGEAPGVGNGEISGFDRTLVYGPTSELLRSSVYALGILQESWFTNLMKCSFPENREGKPKEYEMCIEYLMNEISTLDPEIIFCMGKGSFPFLMQRPIHARLIPLTHPSSYIRSFKFKKPDPKGYALHIKGQLV